MAMYYTHILTSSYVHDFYPSNATSDMKENWPWDLAPKALAPWVGFGYRCIYVQG